MEEAEVKPNVVVLVHGMNTRAHWQHTLPNWLRVEGKLDVKPVSYGYVGFFDFLRPGRARETRVAYVLKKLNEIRAEYPPDQSHMTIVAHSYGTYLVTRILLDNTYFTIGDLLLCGSIAPAKLDWKKIRNQTRSRKGEVGKGTILNDHSVRDFWPVLAMATTKVYDSTGTYGIKDNTVYDRTHDGGHSEYFKKGFVEKFWKPFVDTSKIVDPAESGEKEGRKDITPPLWFYLFERPTIRALLLVLVTAAVWFAPKPDLAITTWQELVAWVSSTAGGQERAGPVAKNQQKHVADILREALSSGPNGTVNQDFTRRMRSWLRTKGIRVPIAVFLNASRFDETRVEMMGDLLTTPASVPDQNTPLRLPTKLKEMGNLIAQRFGEAGFGRVQQIAAVSNAIAESGLNPRARLTRGMDSVGLFQLNRKGGLGTGHSVDALMDPEVNIRIIIEAAKKVPAFAQATTVEGAIEIFVTKIERPANRELEIRKRVQIANSLIGSF